MKKQKPDFFKQETFDSTQAAKEIMNGYEHKMHKIKTGLVIALIAEICYLISWIGGGNGKATGALEVVVIGVLCIGYLATFVAYIIGGGLKMAVIWTIKFARIGWWIIPFWIIDLAGLFCGFALGMTLLVWGPIVYIGLNYMQTKRDYESAKLYLAGAMGNQAQ